MKYLFTLLLAALVAVPAGAACRQGTVPQPDIIFYEPEVLYKGCDSLLFRFKFRIPPRIIRGKSQYRIVYRIVSPLHSDNWDAVHLSLSGTAYTRREERLLRRSGELEGHRAKTSQWSVKRKRREHVPVEYTLTLPYRDWMLTEGMVLNIDREYSPDFRTEFYELPSLGFGILTIGEEERFDPDPESYRNKTVPMTLQRIP